MTTPTTRDAQHTPDPFRHFGGMCWPTPCEHLNDVAYALSHSEATEEMKQVQLVGASVINAYRELVRLSAKKRNAIIRELRKGPAMPTEGATK